MASDGEVGETSSEEDADEDAERAVRLCGSKPIWIPLPSAEEAVPYDSLGILPLAGEWLWVVAIRCGAVPLAPSSPDSLALADGTKVTDGAAADAAAAVRTAMNLAWLASRTLDSAPAGPPCASASSDAAEAAGSECVCLCVPPSGAWPLRAEQCSAVAGVGDDGRLGNARAAEEEITAGVLGLELLSREEYDVVR